jgi:formate hydrogenlyase subunit 6/NADH:ubiquinone oxidoreductase subunit I
MSSELNALGVRYPVLAPGCTGCRACHEICPDYVFEVYKLDQPVDTPQLLALIGAQADSAEAT